MEIRPQIFTAKVMHKRLFPKVNGFTYNVYYLALPIAQINQLAATKNLAINKPGILSFHEIDHNKTASGLADFINPILKEHKLDQLVMEVMLITMPRILGYVFNPVSFWLCLDESKKLRAVLAVVNNTFGQTHSYLCMHEDGRVIAGDDLLQARKLFHVSPFLQREGHYEFRFSVGENKLGIWIDFYNEDGKKQLITSLTGYLQPLTKSNLRKVFFIYPLITLKTIFMIHWQALKLVIKGIKYIPKPKQLEEKLSITKM